MGNDVKALAKPETAGEGAFSGVLSTPAGWVFLDTLITLLIGCVLGVVGASGRHAHPPRGE